MLKEITDKNQWDKLLSSGKGASFLQSWAWGGFQESVRGKAVRLSWNNQIITQAIKMSLPLGKFYWYIPRGPLLVDESADHEKALRDLFAYFKKDASLFGRVDPAEAEGRRSSVASAKEDWGSMNLSPTLSTQPQCTSILDITPSEEDLLQKMHQKTRYNIRLAQKKGVKIVQGKMDDFLKLNKQTARRDQFSSHPDEYYLKMSKTLSSENLKVWSAQYNQQTLAVALVIYFDKTATYVHGASSSEHRNLMAPYLLHWQIIKDAKSRGFRYYDWGGANPQDETDPGYKKSWQGITRFKAGFGGRLKCYPDSYDLINKPGWYSIYRLLRRARRFF